MILSKIDILLYLPSSSRIVTSATGGGPSGLGITRFVGENVTMKTSGDSGLLSSLILTCPQATSSFGPNVIVPKPASKSV